MYLGHDGKVQVYANATIQPSSPVNADLLLDQSEANIYVMTRNTVCAQKTYILPLNVPKCDAANHVVCTNCDNCFARHQKQHFHSKPLAQMSPHLAACHSAAGRFIVCQESSELLTLPQAGSLSRIKGIKQKRGGRPESAGGNTQRGQLAAKVRGRGRQRPRQQWY